MLYQVYLTDLIPEHNFYRLLDQAIDFRFLYKSTKKYYGQEGQELQSISSNTANASILLVPISSTKIGIYKMN